jgi:hypothetical protein
MNRDTVTQFIAGANSYTFPQTVLSVNDNFAKQRVVMQPLPGVNGAYDELGGGVTQTEPGEVEIGLMLMAAYPAEMTAKEKALSALAQWGKGLLYKQPYDQLQTARFCYARVKDVQWISDAKKRPWQNHEVKLIFSVDDPRWYSRPASVPVWGGGVWGGSLWGGSAGTAYAGTPLTVNVTNEGNATAPVLITLRCAAAQTITTPTIERLYGGVVMEQIIVRKTISAHQFLLVDTRALKVRYNAEDAYADMEATRSYWLQIDPGVNSFRLSSALGTDAGAISIRFDSAWIA